jgi:hypothetical protein
MLRSENKSEQSGQTESSDPKAARSSRTRVPLLERQKVAWTSREQLQTPDQTSRKEEDAAAPDPGLSAAEMTGLLSGESQSVNTPSNNQTELPPSGEEKGEEAGKKQSTWRQYLPNRDYAHPILLLLAWLMKPFLVVGLVLALFLFIRHTPLAEYTSSLEGLLTGLENLWKPSVPDLKERFQKLQVLVVNKKMPKGAFYHKGGWLLIDPQSGTPSRSRIEKLFPLSSYYIKDEFLNAQKGARKTSFASLDLDPDQGRAIAEKNGISMASLAGWKVLEVKGIELPGREAKLPASTANQSLSRRGIYLHGGASASRNLGRHIRNVHASHANSIVFDIKDVVGAVNFPSSHTIASEVQGDAKYGYHTPIRDLKKAVATMKASGVYTIARVACFQDMLMSRVKKEWSIRKKSGGIYLHKGKPLWLDPSLPEVHNYLLQIVHEVALSGVDEVQFDYIRYPAEGNLKEVSLRNVKDYRDKVRHLRRFLKKAQGILASHNVLSSIDVFGIVAWGEIKDVMSTGQDLDQLAWYTDIISPMLYPSHFGKNFEGISNPADAGYHFIHKGTNKVRDIAGDRVTVRPWLQAFAWRVSSYGPQYIRDQIRGGREAQGKGWLMWNAASSYDKVYQAVGTSQTN